jgi:hypothetical protein
MSTAFSRNECPIYCSVGVVSFFETFPLPVRDPSQKGGGNGEYEAIDIFKVSQQRGDDPQHASTGSQSEIAPAAILVVGTVPLLSRVPKYLADKWKPQQK